MIVLALGGCAAHETTEGNEVADDTATDSELCVEAGNEHDGEPPPPPSTAATPDSPDLVFAVSKLYLGGTTLDGKMSSSAWTQYGFNLDAAVTDEDRVFCVCKPSSGAKPSAIDDGELGRDNNFGRSLFPILTSISSDVEKQTNYDLGQGDYSWLFRLQGVGAESAYAGLTAQAYVGAKLLAENGSPMFPKQDGSDVWRVTNESVNAGDVALPRLQFADAYTVPAEDGGTIWVGRGVGTIRLTLSVSLALQIHDPVVMLPISADRTAIKAGMLGGTLLVDEVIAEAARFAGEIDPALCPPSSTFEAIAQQIRQAADLLPGGAVDFTATCKDVSIGIAFDAVAAQIGDVAPPADPPAQPCWE